MLATSYNCSFFKVKVGAAINTVITISETARARCCDLLNHAYKRNTHASVETLANAVTN